MTEVGIFCSLAACERHKIPVCTGMTFFLNLEDVLSFDIHDSGHYHRTLESGSLITTLSSFPRKRETSRRHSHASGNRKPSIRHSHESTLFVIPAKAGSGISADAHLLRGRGRVQFLRHWRRARLLLLIQSSGFCLPVGGLSRQLP